LRLGKINFLPQKLNNAIAFAASTEKNLATNLHPTKK